MNRNQSEGDDGEGGLSNEDQQHFGIGPKSNDSREAEEPIYFDQTNRNMGSIQKNMIFSQREDGKGFGRGAATKAMLGLNPASTMPNYSVGVTGQVQ